MLTYFYFGTSSRGYIARRLEKSTGMSVMAVQMSTFAQVTDGSGRFCGQHWQSQTFAR